MPSTLSGKHDYNNNYKVECLVSIMYISNMSSGEQSKLIDCISEVFSDSVVKFVEIKPPQHDLLMPEYIFSVDIGSRASADLVDFITDPNSGFKRHDSCGDVGLGSSAYPRASIRRGPLMLGIPEGSEDLCIYNLNKHKDDIQAILKYHDALKRPVVKNLINRTR